MPTVINSWQEYARTVIEVDDLDPTYNLMRKVRGVKGPDFLDRLTLHMFMFYDMGEAAKCAYATETGDFWEYIMDTYPTAKRGTERRHFRGSNGLGAIAAIRAKGTPHDFWVALHESNYTQLCYNILNNFQGCQIGPYFAWKAMDILDRCHGMPVSLSIREAVRGLPAQPLQCAKDVFPHLTTDQALSAIVEATYDLPAPGDPFRNCGYSEAETILCTIKGFFQTRTYKIGDDVAKRHKQLKDFPELRVLLPPNLDWTQYEAGNLDTTTVSA